MFSFVNRLPVNIFWTMPTYARYYEIIMVMVYELSIHSKGVILPSESTKSHTEYHLICDYIFYVNGFEFLVTHYNLWVGLQIQNDNICHRLKIKILSHKFESVATDSNIFPQIRINILISLSVPPDSNMWSHIFESVAAKIAICSHRFECDSHIQICLHKIRICGYRLKLFFMFQTSL